LLKTRILARIYSSLQFQSISKMIIFLMQNTLRKTYRVTRIIYNLLIPFINQEKITIYNRSLSHLSHVCIKTYTKCKAIFYNVGDYCSSRIELMRSEEKIIQNTILDNVIFNAIFHIISRDNNFDRPNAKLKCRIGAELSAEFIVNIITCARIFLIRDSFDSRMIEAHFPTILVVLFSGYG